MTGTIVDAPIVSDGEDDWLTVRYAYVVGGKRYEGCRFQPNSKKEVIQPSKRPSMVARYGAGTAVVVFHDPGRPERSALERGSLLGWSAWALVVVPAPVWLMLYESLNRG